MEFGYSEAEVCDAYIKDSSENILEKLFSFLNELFEKCLYKSKEKTSDEFEDEEDDTFLYKDDWDCGYMEYVWFTILKRSNFWATTPRNFFEQLEIHQNLNTTNKDNVEVI